MTVELPVYLLSLFGLGQLVIFMLMAELVRSLRHALDNNDKALQQLDECRKRRA